MGWKLCLLGLILLIGAVELRANDANDVEALQGGWTMVLVFRNGEAAPPDLAKSGELVIEDQEYRAKLGSNAMTAAIKIDSSKSPKEIDLSVSSGENKGQTLKGIYKITGDDLTICRGLTSKEPRPTEFAAPLDSGLLLVTWKRSKTFVNPKTKAFAEDLKRLERQCRLVEIELGGTKIPRRAFEKDTLVLKGNRFASYVAGKLVHGEFKIDPLAKPKTIDIIFTEGPGKGHSQKGIYELDGETQKVCIAMPDRPRPTEFVTGPDRFDIIQILKREHP